MNPNANNSRTDAGSAGLVSSKSFNQAGAYNNQGYNTFDHSHRHFTTERFAHVTPFFMKEALSGDVFRLHVNKGLQSLAADVPIQTKVYNQNAIYQVPLSAIMPNHWKKLLVQPSFGDDVPDNIYPAFNPHYAYNLMWIAFESQFQDPGDLTEYPGVSTILCATIYICSLFNSDSLLRRFGVFMPVDSDAIMDAATPLMKYWRYIYEQSNSDTHKELSFAEYREMLEDLVNGEHDFVVEDWKSRVTEEEYIAWYEAAREFFSHDSQMRAQFEGHSIDLSPVYAYQMICSQYYSNDKIDYVHDAKDWLENQKALALDLQSWSSYPDFFPHFTYNGKELEYDICSYAWLQKLMKDRLFQSTFHNLSTSVGFWTNIFGFNKSLRKGDYFSSSRKLPLAPGDITASVQSDKVSALDMNKALWMQRFLNTVNRASSDAYKYLKEFFGADAIKLEPMPNEIIVETQLLGNDITTNTADQQGKVTSRLVSSDSTTAYDIYLDQPSYVIGLSSYFAEDVPYIDATPRSFFNITRSEKFNPFMQHIGDQAVDRREIGFFDWLSNTNFGYQTRYAEYKFSLSLVSGAFRKSLKSWIMQNNFLFFPTQNTGYSYKYYEFKLDSNFIRNTQKAMDNLLPSSTGTAAEHFHFICTYDVNLKVNSKMQKMNEVL